MICRWVSGFGVCCFRGIGWFHGDVNADPFAFGNEFGVGQFVDVVSCEFRAVGVDFSQVGRGCLVVSLHCSCPQSVEQDAAAEAETFVGWDDQVRASWSSFGFIHRRQSSVIGI